MGATAAQALLGKSFLVTKERGKLVESKLAPYVMATVHPSSVLRARDEAARHAEMQSLIDDLKVAAKLLK